MMYHSHLQTDQKKYPKMESGKRLKNTVVLHHLLKKIRQKEVECIIFIINWSGIGLCSYWCFTSCIYFLMIPIITIRFG